MAASQRRNKQGVLQLYKSRSWKSYMFKVTSSTYFHYFSEKNLSKAKDQVILAKVKSVNAVSHPTKGGLHAFEVSFMGKGSPWLVGCQTQEEQISWMEAIMPGSSAALRRQQPDHQIVSRETSNTSILSSPTSSLPPSANGADNIYSMDPTTSIPPPTSPPPVSVRPPVPQAYIDPTSLNMPRQPPTSTAATPASPTTNSNVADGYMPVLRPAQQQPVDGYMPVLRPAQEQQPVDDYMPMQLPPDAPSDYMDMSYTPRPSPQQHIPQQYENPSPPPPPPPSTQKLSAAHQMLANQFTPEQLHLLASMMEQLRVGGGSSSQGDTQRSDDFGYLVTKTAGTLSESILVTEDDDPDAYDKRPSWAKAVYEELTGGQSSIRAEDDELSSLQYEAFTIQRSELADLEHIGEGQFGEVFKAVYTPSGGGLPLHVAVKTSKAQSSKDELASFMKEMAVMANMMHPNIVRLYGVMTQDVPSPWLILEYLPYGDLRSYLIKSGGKPPDQLVKYMVDVAMGMHYLAEKGLVHRDLAARNILVGENELCKVADFGMLRELPDDVSIYKSTSNTPCPIRWMAPESLSKRVFSVASDVWSYGVLQWEMMCPKKLPYHGMDNFQVATRVSQGYRMPVPRGSHPVAARVMKACWHSEPRKRPSFLLIATLLSTRSSSQQQRSRLASSSQ